MAGPKRQNGPKSKTDQKRKRLNEGALSLMLEYLHGPCLLTMRQNIGRYFNNGQSYRRRAGRSRHAGHAPTRRPRLPDSLDDDVTARVRVTRSQARFGPKTIANSALYE